MPGEHNVSNALAAFAVADVLSVPQALADAALKAYKGTDRRFEHKGVIGGVTVIDDYAHHPTEITATLKAAGNYPHRKLWCVFQPHTYSRTHELFNDFVEVLKRPAVTLLAEIFAAREDNDTGISSADLCRNIPGAVYCSTLDKVADRLRQAARPGDLILTVGAGDIYRAGEKLLERDV